MKTKRVLGVAVFSAAMGLFGAVCETDFATIEYPETWDPATGKAFQVKVTPKDSAAGQDLSVHLHAMRVDGYEAFAGWQPPKKNIVAGKTYAFNFKPKPGENTRRYGACAFLAPGGDYGKKTKERFVDINLPPPPPYPDRPATVTFKKSYIWLEDNPAPARVGEDVVLKVHYYLDPSDTWGPKPTKLIAMPLGPWIDNPDGVHNKRRGHVSFGGTMFSKELKVEPGEHTIDFRFKLGTSYRYNSCFFLLKFKQPDGKDWPWDWRGGSLTVVPDVPYFRMFPTARGGAFYYDETPSVALIWGYRIKHGLRIGKAVVTDCENRVVLEKEVELNPARHVQMLTFPELKKRGVFAVTLAAPGMGEKGEDVTDFCYLARIPKFRRDPDRPTPFGVTNVADLDTSALAYDLGFTLCRHFTSWNGIQPAKNKWHLSGLDARIRNNVAAGLKPWIQLYGPPAWALPPGMSRTGEFEPAPFDLKAWEDVLLTLAKRYEGKLYGFEFLNEIVPGKACDDPVKTYVDICRTGYEALKKHDPNLVCQLAGGLWPHTFRIDLLNAGVAKYVDVLPVHYSTYEGVAEAERDLAVRNVKNVFVGDNETASGASVWNFPPEMAFRNSRNQCLHVMTRWPDVLTAGGKFVVYFGGGADACGNWSYMLDLTSPRPVLATLAVVQGRLAYAKPVGKFFMGETVCHLFEKDGKAILFLATPGKAGVKVKVPAAGALTVTDYQGNETTAADGVVATGDMPVIVDGGDLAALKLHAALSIGSAAAPTALPQVVADAGETIPVPVKVVNVFDEAKTFTVTPSNPSWGAGRAEKVTLAPGESKTFEAVYRVTSKIVPSNRLSVEIAADGLAPVSKPCTLFVADESSLGNLVPNGTFTAGLAPWKGDGKLVDAPLPGAPDNTALAIEGAGRGYRHETQKIDLPVPGATYLYTAWARGEGMGGGSNLDEQDSKGVNRNHMMLRVFSIPGSGTKGWSYLFKKITFGADARTLAMTPVAEGKKGARILFDNVQLSLYKGSDFVAFASGDQAKSSPVPLLCENQVRPESGYAWNEKNVAGLANFTWTKDALVFEAVVEDDAMDARGILSEDGEEALKGDAIALCLFPRMGADGTPENDQLRWYITKVNPGGSGFATVYRPKKYSMGAKSGQLCKDSSVYQIELTREGTTTRYKLTIPWGEIPGFSPAKGASFGCNVVLTDADGDARRASMVWGGGLKDDSADCGLVTLVP